MMQSKLKLSMMKFANKANEAEEAADSNELAPKGLTLAGLLGKKKPVPPTDKFL